MLWMMDWWSQGWDPVGKLWSVSQVKAQLGFAGNPMALFYHRSFLPMLLNPVWKLVIYSFFLGALRCVKAVTQRLLLPFSAIVATVALRGDCRLAKYWSVLLPSPGGLKAGLRELVGSLSAFLSLSLCWCE